MCGLRSVRASTLVALLSLGGVVAPAADAGATVSPRLTVLSPWISDAVKARLPKYNPAREDQATVVLADSAEVRDNILHLPTMTVSERGRASREPIDWLTSTGRTDLALKRYPGTKIGNILGLNTPWALARLKEDVEAGRKDALKGRGAAVLIEGTARDHETAELLKAALMPINRD